MKKNTFIPNINIRQVIKARLALQTTQRYLIEQFNVPTPTFEVLTSSGLLSRLRMWDDSTKKAFYMVVGGASNIKITKEFYEELLKMQVAEINTFKGEKIKEMVIR